MAVGLATVDFSKVTLLITTAVVLSFLRFLSKAYNARKAVDDLRKKGLPMPPFKWLSGHMLALKTTMQKLPLDAVTHYAFAEIALSSKENMFYVDFWPLSPPILVVTTPFVAAQVIQAKLPKPKSISDVLESLTGGPNLLTMPESQWKQWRTVFNPGFNPSYVLDQVPKIVQEVELFYRILQRKASENELFQLDKVTLRLTLEVIGVVALDTQFDFQRNVTPVPRSFRTLIEWTSYGTEINPFKRWNPLRPLMRWYHARVVDQYIRTELDKHFIEYKSHKDGKSEGKGSSVRSKSSIATLALESYTSEFGTSHKETLDPTFRSLAASQIRLFMLAGHDTTSSSIVYALHNLYTNPECLDRVRAEHDSVFGPDPSSAGNLLTKTPALLNQLPYTLAVIKESLRLFPPSASLRAGNQETLLTDEQGRQYPTAGCYVWLLQHGMHKNPEFWPEPDNFIPERWLVGPDDPLYPVKGAWRPFELGPRNCIGQTLALTEIKIVMVLVARRFDINPAYEEWEDLYPSKGVKTVRGSRAYLVHGGGGGAHPAKRYPCRVKVRESS